MTTYVTSCISLLLNQPPNEVYEFIYLSLKNKKHKNRIFVIGFTLLLYDSFLVGSVPCGRKRVKICNLILDVNFIFSFIYVAQFRKAVIKWQTPIKSSNIRRRSQIAVDSHSLRIQLCQFHFGYWRQQCRKNSIWFTAHQC